MVTENTYWGVQSTFQAIQWLSSDYNYCDVNEVNGLPPPHCSSGGGGGCVAFGTPILTPAGYVPVQNLRPGNSGEEFNFSSESLEAGLLISANTTSVNRLVSINHGMLYLTPTDQPIFIFNQTFEGWLLDPQNLTTGDEIFNPVAQSWIAATSVQTIDQQATVFDVVTSGANNFVAHGALLDFKPG